MLPRRETRWNLQGCLELPDRSQPLVGRSSPYCGDMWMTYRYLNKFFFRLSIRALFAKIQPNKIVLWCPDGDFWRLFCVLHFQRAAAPQQISTVSRLGSVTARHRNNGRQPNFAALNRRRHLYPARRPSRWELAHILLYIFFHSLDTGRTNKHTKNKKNGKKVVRLISHTHGSARVLWGRRLKSMEKGKFDYLPPINPLTDLH